MATRKDSAKNSGTPSEIELEQNRKHERLRQRDREQHRRLYLGVGIAIAAAVVFMVIGLIYEFAVSPTRVVATVGEDRIIARDFGKRVKMEQSDLTNALRFYALQEQQFGNQGFFSQQINQLQATLASPFALGQQTLDKMIQEIIIRREAASRGITVSDAEVDVALREEVASGLGLVTEPQATATAEAGVIATATAASWTPTPEPTAAIAVSDDVTGTEEISATDALSPTATPAPTLGPAPVITETAYTEGLAALETSIRTTTGMSLAEYRETIRNRLLADKVEEAVAGDEVATTEEQVNARHILISEIQPTPAPTDVPEGDPTPEPTATATAVPEGEPTPVPTPGPRTREEALELAQELRTRIVDGGEDWMTIAAEYSDDRSNRDAGGDLGWFGRGAMVAPFEEAAFALPVGEISEPISTTFGYHLIEVLERDDAREKDEATLQQERSQAFSTWLTAQVAAANVTRNDIVSNLPRDMR